MTWTLILLFAGNAQPLPAVIPGYTSEQACRETGAESVRAGREQRDYVRAYLCVRVR